MTLPYPKALISLCVPSLPVAEHLVVVPKSDSRTPCGCGRGSRPGGTTVTWQHLRSWEVAVRAARGLDRLQLSSRSEADLDTTLRSHRKQPKKRNGAQHQKNKTSHVLNLNSSGRNFSVPQF